MSQSPVNWLNVAKYVIYGLLALDIVFFLRGDLATSAGLLSGASDWTRVITVFSETLDTVAWVTLVLLFELETAVISVNRLRGNLQWLFSGVRVLCYVTIISSLFGYLAMWQTLTNPELLLAINPCTLIGQGYFYFAGFDLYPALTGENCSNLLDQTLVLISGTQIIGTLADLQFAERLALVDVINAATWLLVVILLEAEVYLQLHGRFSQRLRQLTRRMLVPLSCVLLGCALYWLIYSDFLDFWDALLWLIAFAFIEMNILDWQLDNNRQEPPR